MSVLAIDYQLDTLPAKSNREERRHFEADRKYKNLVQAASTEWLNVSAPNDLGRTAA